MVCLQRYTNFFDTLRSMGGKDSNLILTCLYCNKWNEINVWHSDTQKHFANKKWFKCYKYFLYRLTQKFSDTLRSMGGKD